MLVEALGVEHADLLEVLVWKLDGVLRATNETRYSQLSLMRATVYESEDDRLIDLSYGAALRLGMVETGTARVEVRAIDVATGPRSAADDQRLADEGADTWLQAGAYGRRHGAEELARRLQEADLQPVSIHDGDGLFRVWLGPYSGRAQADSVVEKAIELGFERPHRVKR